MHKFFYSDFAPFCERIVSGQHQEARSLLNKGLDVQDPGRVYLQCLEKLLDAVEEREARLADLVAELSALRLVQSGREKRLERENTDLRTGLNRGLRQAAALSSNPAMRLVFRQAERVAAVPVNVLITGETGTGKGLLAQYIHYSSPRAKAPLVSLNCAAIPASLLESELFGIEKGVASGVSERQGHFESASGGTLFLDEIGDMPSDCQAKILKALESGSITRVGGRKQTHVDIRLISATHKDLDQACARGEFRQDLFYRLKVIHLHLPPLRERREDIAPLARHFLQAAVVRYGLSALSFAPESLRLLELRDWPGNVRELEHEVERAALLSVGPIIQPEDLSPRLPDSPLARPSVKAGWAGPEGLDLAGKLRDHPDLLASIARRMAAYTLKAAPFTSASAKLSAPGQGVVAATGDFAQNAPEPALSDLTGLPNLSNLPNLHDAELDLVQRTMAECGGNKTHAAQRLGISREGLRKKLKRLGIS
jgi:DNA-binding NtrC family response regulator